MISGKKLVNKSGLNEMILATKEEKKIETKAELKAEQDKTVKLHTFKSFYWSKLLC